METKTWVVTGNSQKADGVLVVVDAVDEATALVRAARALGAKLAQRIHYEGEELGWYAVDEKEEDLPEGVEETREASKWDLELLVTELRKGVNLTDVVCW